MSMKIDTVDIQQGKLFGNTSVLLSNPIIFLLENSSHEILRILRDKHETETA